MSDRFWLATKLGNLDMWQISEHRVVPLKFQQVAVLVGLIPLCLEFGVIGGVAFGFVSHPPFGWSPAFKGLGWPDIVGWIAAILAIFLYIGLHASRLLGLILTAFWTLAWAALFQRYGWAYGLGAGAMALVGHLGIVSGLMDESTRSPQHRS